METMADVAWLDAVSGALGNSVGNARVKLVMILVVVVRNTNLRQTE